MLSPLFLCCQFRFLMFYQSLYISSDNWRKQYFSIFHILIQNSSFGTILLLNYMYVWLYIFSDNGTSSKYSKFPRKKESNGNKSFQDSGGRRPNPQRTKSAADKRPRFRGNYPDRPRNDVILF